MEISEHTHMPHDEGSPHIPSDEHHPETHTTIPQTAHHMPEKEHLLRESIVGPAWELVMTTSFLKKFNFFPSLLSTVYLGCIVLYQLAFSYVYIFKLKDQFFALIIQWVHTSYFWQFVTALVIGILLHIFLTPIAEGGLISLIARRQERSADIIDNKGRIGYGISRGLLNFLPLFELGNSLALFKLLSIITFYLFLLRIFGKDYLVSISICMTLYLGFSFVINILFSYARFFIIFEDKKALEALSLSVRMAIHNIEITFHLYFTLLLVYVRTFITAIIFIVFPFVISGLFTYITISWLQIFSIGILSILFFALLVFISHLNSVLEIFVETIWYNTYKENRKYFDMGETAHDEHHSEHH
ncbi:MAG: hypothetical protein PHH70_01865 [Candidatus Gracilibacteria bacterium]|nr:hypothetical protein [Candidatus Gracilibacteria bacterium]